jgi:5'-nucleotidase
MLLALRLLVWVCVGHPCIEKVGSELIVFQNHDLDFGVSQFSHLAQLCHFPWLLANVLDPALGDGVSLGHCEKTFILTSSNGIKVGVIGLAEREW